MNKKNLFGMGILLSSMIAGPVMANSVVLSQTGYSFGGGGEFRAVTSAPELLDPYASVAIVNGGFETFCIQASVYFSPGATYSFTLSDTDSQGRALTQGAAFLYYQFAKGLLPGYDYLNTPNRQINAGHLQSAFWKLQGNQTGGGGFPSGGAGNTFYDYALSNLGGANLALANNGLYNVQVFQMWDQAGNTRQNQLVLGPDRPPGVPDSGTTLSLLVISVAGISIGKYSVRKISGVR
jgi:hypothetical protein